MQHLMTTSQVATGFGVDTSTVTRWAKAGHLTASKLGNGRTSALIFHPGDVEAFGAALRALAAERAA